MVAENTHSPVTTWKLLSIALGVGFHLTVTGLPSILFIQSHRDWIFEAEFSISGNYDEFIVDAVSVWIAGDGHTLPGSCALLGQAHEECQTLLPDAAAGERTRHREQEDVRLVVNVADIVDGYSWAGYLVDAMQPQMQPESCPFITGICWTRCSWTGDPKCTLYRATWK